MIVDFKKQMDKRAERIRRETIQKEQDSLPKYIPIGIIGNPRPDPSYKDSLGIIQSVNYNKHVAVLDILSIWKRYIKTELVTKEEKQKYVDISKEIEKLSIQQAMYSNEKAIEAYNQQDLTDPSKVRTLEDIQKSYQEANDIIRTKISNLIREKYSVLDQPQEKLLVLLEKIDFIKDIEKAFKEALQLWFLPQEDYEYYLKYFENSNSSWLSLLRNKTFYNFVFFGLDK